MGGKSLFDAFHKPPSTLVREPVALEDDRDVVIERFSKINIVSQITYEIFELMHGFCEQAGARVDLPGSKASAKGGFFSFQVAVLGSKLGFSPIGKAVNIEALDGGIVKAVKENVNLSINGVGDVAVEDGVGSVFVVEE
ncbi:MAG: hypothetical protein MAG431_01039 [Chloroflexi bacterium]|nr:hypothetical protein [Chloroflexota bacterium]